MFSERSDGAKGQFAENQGSLPECLFPSVGRGLQAQCGRSACAYLTRPGVGGVPEEGGQQTLERGGRTLRGWVGQTPLLLAEGALGPHL